MFDLKGALLVAGPLLAVLLCAVMGAGAGAEEPKKNPVVVLDTSAGAIHIELDAEKAPISTKNFLDYVEAKHYDGLIFHRVIPNFMVQGGGMTPDMQQRKTRAPIKNEAGNGLKNERGTLAMARTNVVDSATSQFFINVKSNDFLNHRDETAQGFGYAVFGKVTEGMDVVDKIVGSPTGSKGGHQDVPVEPILIKTATVKK
jgi:peptidyl-prolyl cis-trans isomerase A (cyclophilin A)